MTKIEDNTACAKRGGPSFNNTIRVNPYELTCPFGYEPCSAFTQPSETVCWLIGKDKSDCPIIDIILVNEREEEAKLKQLGYSFTSQGFDLNEEESTTSTRIAFSKQNSIDNNHSKEAIMSVTLNTFVPCFGYDSERLVL